MLNFNKPATKDPRYVKASEWAMESKNSLTDVDEETRKLMNEYSEKSLEDIAAVFARLFDNAMALLRLNGIFVGVVFAVVRTQPTNDMTPSRLVVAALICWLVSMSLLFFLCRRRHRPRFDTVESMFTVFEKKPKTNFHEYICRYRHMHEAWYHVLISRESKIFNASIMITIAGVAMLILSVAT